MPDKDKKKKKEEEEERGIKFLKNLINQDLIKEKGLN